MSEELIRFLGSISVPSSGNNLLQVLKDIGVEKSADLELLEESDLQESGRSTV